MGKLIRDFTVLRMRIKNKNIVWCVISLSLKGLITVHDAIDVYWVWTIIALGSIPVLDFITNDISSKLFYMETWLS